MTAQEAPGSLDGLFDATYTVWMRRLHQSIPLSPAPDMLSESTVAEPTELLRQRVDEAFGDRITDRFESTFGGGNRHLIEALARRYGVASGQILTTTGASNGIEMTLRALLARGGHVLVEAPQFDLLKTMPASLGASVTHIERRGPEFMIDPEELRRALQPHTRAVLISNPHNPSGAVLPPDRLRQLADAAERVGAKLIVDEVYGDFLRDSGAASSSRLTPNIVTVNSLTKVYGLHSLRCGWIVAAPHVVREIAAANECLEFGVSKLTHAIAAHVFDHIEEFENHWRSILKESHPVVVRHAAAMARDGLIEGDVPPYGCMYFPKLLDFPATRALAQELLCDYNLLVAHGEFFGRGGHIRIGYGHAEPSLDRGLGRLHEALLTIRRGGQLKSRTRLG